MLNVLLIAFIVLSVAVRFVFPAISQEGRTFWLVRASPISIRQVVMSKFAVYFLPMLIMSLLFTLLSFWIMESSAFHMLVAVVLITLLTFIATGMGIGLGAIFPRFDIENVAKIPASYGGIVYMLICGGIMLVVIAAAGAMFYIYTWEAEPLKGEWGRYHYWFTASFAAIFATPARWLKPMIGSSVSFPPISSLPTPTPCSSGKWR